MHTMLYYTGEQAEVDRRWASVVLPRGMKSHYAPFADHSTFTSAEWFHLMVYAGRYMLTPPFFLNIYNLFPSAPSRSLFLSAGISIPHDPGTFLFSL